MQLRTLFASSLIFLVNSTAAQTEGEQWKLPPNEDGIEYYTGRLEPTESHAIDDENFFTGRKPSEHEQGIPHSSQDQFMKPEPSKHEKGIPHKSQDPFMMPQPSKHEKGISHPTQAEYMEHYFDEEDLGDLYDDEGDIYIEDEDYYDDYYDGYYFEESDFDNFFAAHLDFYTMTDDAFYEKWGYDTDPIVVWESVSDRIDIDLGWVYEESFSSYTTDDYEEFFESVLSGLDSLDSFIGRQYGYAFATYRDTIEEYQARLELTQEQTENFTEQDWKDLKKEIFKGVTKLNELARDNRLVAAGQLKKEYAKQTMAWETVQAHLDKLGTQTHEKLEALTIAQAEASQQIPVWAACTITGLSVALFCMMIVGCGVIRQQRRKLKMMELECQAAPVTQRDHTTARQGTLPDPVVAIKKMNENE